MSYFWDKDKTLWYDIENEGKFPIGYDLEKFFDHINNYKKNHGLEDEPLTYDMYINIPNFPQECYYLIHNMNNEDNFALLSYIVHINDKWYIKGFDIDKINKHYFVKHKQFKVEEIKRLLNIVACPNCMLSKDKHTSNRFYILCHSYEEPYLKNLYEMKRN